MKKLLLMSLTLIMLITTGFKVAYAEEIYGGNGKGWSDWSTTPTGNLGEVSAIQYGVLKPKTWSNWSLDPFTGQILPTEPTDGHWYVNDSIKASGYNGYHFEKCEDHGSKKYPNSSKSWSGAGAKDVYTWDLGENMKIKSVFIDLDTYVDGSYTEYYTPKVKVYVDGTYVGSDGGWNGDVPNSSINNINRVGRVVKVTMEDGGGNGRNKTWLYDKASYVQTEKIEYSHVIEWNEPADDCWCFTPYPLQDGAGSQIPVERIVYSYPYPPVIGLKTNYYFVGQEVSVADLKANALATDIVDGIINSKVKIDKIEYQNGTIVNNPTSLDTSIEQSFELYASVINSRNIPAEAHRSYMIFDLYGPSSENPDDINPEEYTDVDIYDRFVSTEYLNSINAKSLWEIDMGYKDALNSALAKTTGPKSQLN